MLFTVEHHTFSRLKTVSQNTFLSGRWNGIRYLFIHLFIVKLLLNPIFFKLNIHVMNVRISRLNSTYDYSMIDVFHKKTVYLALDFWIIWLSHILPFGYACLCSSRDASCALNKMLTVSWYLSWWTISPGEYHKPSRLCFGIGMIYKIYLYL